LKSELKQADFESKGRFFLHEDSEVPEAKFLIGLKQDNVNPKSAGMKGRSKIDDDARPAMNADLDLCDIEKLSSSEVELDQSDPKYSENTLELAKDPKFAIRILASLADGNGCRAIFRNSSKQSELGKDYDDLSLLAPGTDVVTPRNIMRLVLDRPYGDWASIPLARILGDRDGARKAFIAGLEGLIREAHARAAEEADVEVLAIESGSVIITYRCVPRRHTRRANAGVLTTLSDPSRVAAEFRAIFGARFQRLLVHPLHYFLRIDTALLDPSPGATKRYGERPASYNPETDYQVGPPEGMRFYRTPHGWVRIGLKVRGRFPPEPGAAPDAWLEPFCDGNAGLWYRAYHGTTGGAFRGIVGQGFRPSGKGKLGAGVYVSPHPDYADGGYGGEHVVRFSDGAERRFRCILMCGVRPDALVSTGYCGVPRLYPGEDSEWLIEDPRAVRCYGVLVKEVRAAPAAAAAAGGSPAAAPARTRQQRRQASQSAGQA
jgi:hypothetical protein